MVPAPQVATAINPQSLRSTQTESRQTIGVLFPTPTLTRPIAQCGSVELESKYDLMTRYFSPAFFLFFHRALPFTDAQTLGPPSPTLKCRKNREAKLLGAVYYRDAWHPLRLAVLPKLNLALVALGVKAIGEAKFFVKPGSAAPRQYQLCPMFRGSAALSHT